MSIRELTLREMIIERILFAVDEEVLNEEYHTSVEELPDFSDTDLMDLYEDVMFDIGSEAGANDAE